jgi:hypothetical protein
MKGASIWKRISNVPMLNDLHPLAFMPKKSMAMKFQFHKAYSMENFHSSKLNLKSVDKTSSHSILSKDKFSFRPKLDLSNNKTESIRSSHAVIPTIDIQSTHQTVHKDFTAKDFKIIDIYEILKSKDKNVITKAMDIIKNRRDERETNSCEKNEPVNIIVKKSKEIYMIELTTTMVNQEIEKLKNLEIEMANTIQKKEKDLEIKNHEARKNFEDKKKEMEVELERANIISNEKAQFLREIKAKNQNLSSLINENKKLYDMVDNYKELKLFIDHLSPEYHKEKNITLTIEHNKLSEPKVHTSEMKIPSKANVKNKLSRNGSKSHGNDFKFIGNSDGSNQKSNEEFTIYFDNPDQLIEKINSIEEKNLQMMQTNQQEEQSLVDLQNKVKSFKLENKKKIADLKQLHFNLNLKIEENKDEISRFHAQKYNIDKKYLMENFGKIENTLFNIYHMFRYDFDRFHHFGAGSDFKEKKNIIISLSDIEKLLYKFSVLLRRENPEHIIKSVSLLENIP